MVLISNFLVWKFVLAKYLQNFTTEFSKKKETNKKSLVIKKKNVFVNHF